jgi:hypothetical protein
VKLRLKTNHDCLAWSDRLNTHSLNEIIVGYADDGMDSDYIHNFECLLSDGEWVPLEEAFKRHDVVTDNYNTVFREAKTDEEREKGYYL